MTFDKLKRNVYFDPPSEFLHSSRNHAEDFEDYFLPLAQMHFANLHDWGIGGGLEVTGAPGGTEVIVSPGVAIDKSGRLIVLATAGHGDIGNDPPGGDNNEQAVPVHMSLAPHSGKTVYVTIQFSQILRAAEGSGGRLEQVPWLRLQPTAGAGAYVDDGNSVILGIAVISAAGALTDLKTDDGALPYRRRSLGEALEELRIRRSQKAGNMLQETVAGKLKPGTGGGLQLTVPNTGDSILLARDGGTQCASVEVRAGAVICKDASGREVLHFDAANAWLRIGNTGNEGDIIVRDPSGNEAFAINGATANLRVGTSNNAGNVIVHNQANTPGAELDGQASKLFANNIQPYGNTLDVNSRFFRVHGWDLVLDGRSGGNKRALVDLGNRLVVNYAADYANGVDINKLHLSDHIKVYYWQANDEWNPGRGAWQTFFEMDTALRWSEWDFITMCEIGMFDHGTVDHFWWQTDNVSYVNDTGNIVVKWNIEYYDTGTDWLPYNRAVMWLAFRR